MSVTYTETLLTPSFSVSWVVTNLTVTSYEASKVYETRTNTLWVTSTSTAMLYNTKTTTETTQMYTETTTTSTVASSSTALLLLLTLGQTIIAEVPHEAMPPHLHETKAVWPHQHNEFDPALHPADIQPPLVDLRDLNILSLNERQSIPVVLTTNEAGNLVYLPYCNEVFETETSTEILTNTRSWVNFQYPITVVQLTEQHTYTSFVTSTSVLTVTEKAYTAIHSNAFSTQTVTVTEEFDSTYFTNTADPEVNPKIVVNNLVIQETSLVTSIFTELEVETQEFNFTSTMYETATPLVMTLTETEASFVTTTSQAPPFLSFDTTTSTIAVTKTVYDPVLLYTSTVQVFSSKIKVWPFTKEVQVTVTETTDVPTTDTIFQLSTSIKTVEETVTFMSTISVLSTVLKTNTTTTHTTKTETWTTTSTPVITVSTSESTPISITTVTTFETFVLSTKIITCPPASAYSSVSTLFKKSITTPGVHQGDITTSEACQGNIVTSDIHQRNVSTSDITTSDVHQGNIATSDIHQRDVTTPDIHQRDVTTSDVSLE
ncbi:hypothetical protein FHG87_018912 [Trinorchestia longiramus]|nr:hypothetical protein FHG87_018912 [Trinorchestia longiramus]